jgi:hypothetical protein
VGSETRHVVVVLRENNVMSAYLFRIFDLRTDEKNRELRQTTKSMMTATFAKYRVDREYWQSVLILEPLYDVIQSRYDMLDDLHDRVSSVLNSGKTKKELSEIRKKLTTGPRRVRVAFHNEITRRDVDLENPKALAAFKAASESLDYFLQLEHEYMKTYLEAIRNHVRLRRARRRQKNVQPSQPTKTAHKERRARSKKQRSTRSEPGRGDDVSPLFL